MEDILKKLEEEVENQPERYEVQRAFKQGLEKAINIISGEKSTLENEISRLKVNEQELIQMMELALDFIHGKTMFDEWEVKEMEIQLERIKKGE